AHFLGARHASFSPHGETLAVTYADKIEFWDIPLRRPWTKIVMVFVVGFLAVLVLSQVPRLFRLMKGRRRAVSIPPCTVDLIRSRLLPLDQRQPFFHPGTARQERHQGFVLGVRAISRSNARQGDLPVKVVDLREEESAAVVGLHDQVLS